MRKLEEFKNDDNLLSQNELSNIIGGLLPADRSRYTCFTQTASEGCTDTRCEQTIDENGTSTTTITETDNP
ncbi:hypothetical protein [Flavobacterium terrae]|uniref:Uncharacterized protein n=1 Tax=Flavobacterium terrae TaxID=415425 RepID=A0A1M6B9W8_9FLAO|nr:hypothetical protein [Flavobacterium terrae]SHI45457.1 hypothetical protein SAMN05444363_0630 [Flavobacterium terrae]